MGKFERLEVWRLRRQFQSFAGHINKHQHKHVAWAGVQVKQLVEGLIMVPPSIVSFIRLRKESQLELLVRQ
jgi:hypothetical protein